MHMRLSAPHRLDINLDPFSRIEFTFDEEGRVAYSVIDGEFEESGTVTASTGDPPTGDEFVAILEAAVQPDDVVLRIGESLEWINLRDHVIRLVISKRGAGDIV